MFKPSVIQATYCINDTDFTRMVDQYFYKRENSELSPCSMPHNHNGAYSVNEQAFHTPSFGDEEFDITPIGPTATPTSNVSHTSHPPSYQHQFTELQVKNEPMSPQNHQQMCNTNGYHYMTPPLPPSSDHNNHSMGINSANYTNSHQQSPFTSIQSNQHSQHNQHPQLLLLQPHHQQSQTSQMHQQPQQPSHYNVAAMRSYAQSPQANSPNGMASTPGPNPPGAHETTTTSDDSDDSTPHTTLLTGIKRPSPEPVEPDMPKMQKKPKPTKKKKKRDPNEPQKPVSAYALFFRDTQAAIKGSNPNTSFGEVSKIVASMWDGLPAEEKNHYKTKTEMAKKDYLKQLAAYRATQVGKGGVENENAGYGGGYSGYTAGYSSYSPPTGLSSPPIQTASPHQPLPHATMNTMSKKSQIMMSDARLTMNGHPPPPNMMTPPSHMPHNSHVDHQAQQQQQQNQVNSVPQQQNPPLTPNYPHQSPSWNWCYRMGGPPNQ